MTEGCKLKNDIRLKLKTMISQLKNIVFWMLLGGIPFVGNATTIFDLLYSDEVEEITLRTNLVQLLENRNSEENEQLAMIEFEDAAGNLEEWSLKLSVRGKFRRRACDFPPLRLDFDKDDLKARGLEKHDKLKLVTHCLDARAMGNENVLREYLAYQLYNQLTPNSYRVKLVKIRYEDYEKRIGTVKRYGFIIEDTDEMAARLGGKECEDCLNPAPKDIDLAAENLHAFFQYFIGNTDFSLPMMRNLKLVTQPNGKLIPVGYDFDFSGFVNASYAVPANELGQLTIQERFFLGLQVEDAIMRQSIARFRAHKEDFYQLINKFKLLPADSRLEIKNYVDSFYADLDTLEASSSNIELFTQLRSSYPDAIPTGATPAYYGVPSAMK